MLAGKKQDSGVLNAPAKPPGAALADVAATGGDTLPTAHLSPARALQQRLVRELAQPARSWLWHSAGLVLTAILSLWIAGFMLSAGI
ncbi:MAG: hypothetical protein FP825_16000 [Hyphomonas sp.]|uniref:hypothetical protein n=1 Tax=Hyphomonas sp. TaxID=87 RepID=UPI001830E98C|nr:hypothetical protein [Hyphomonas sp.]MBA3069974.1 hypothetical protein [Hyphomonas sp.]MBU3920447.1 hypothetical protein [Alphaproteobacteria bacterium]MBU4060450.1 hypothetical protein [Alphaproteobacteria bacterium]MBU4163118.1 hypothetical protein [Alphaproteobacteria bacterium]